MRAAGLVAAAAIAFTMPSAWAQPKDLSGDAYRRHVCDSRKPGFDFPRCMQRRLGYEVQAATAASVVCPDAGKKKK